MTGNCTSHRGPLILLQRAGIPRDGWRKRQRHMVNIQLGAMTIAVVTVAIIQNVQTGWTHP